MVEAAIYFPFVLMIVFFILILSIVQLNQYIINYQAARVTDICSTSESYYAVNASAAPSFAAGLVQSDMPSEADIIDYYKKKQSRGFRWRVNTSYYASALYRSLNEYSLVKGLVTAYPTVSRERGYTDIINVSVEYDMKMPGFISYITGKEKNVVAVSGTSISVSFPAETIRRYDAMDNQINDYYGGNGFLDNTIRYSDFQFDNFDSFMNKKNSSW